MRSPHNPTNPFVGGVRYTVLRVYARAGETIQMGSSAMQLAGASEDNILVYPPGTSFASATDPTQPARSTEPVFATDIYDCNADDPGAGRISTRAQELAGPAPNPGGWTPCEFTAPADGIYPIIMLPFSSNAGGTIGTVGAPGVGNGRRVSIWDVTVRDSSGVVRPGRLFSHHLALDTSSSTTLAANPVSYLYTPAGYEYRVRFFNHNGETWDMAANDRGVVDATTGERTFASFQWGTGDVNNTLAHSEAVAPQLTAPDLPADSRFPIFFQAPDPVAISGPGGLAETRGYATAPVSPSAALTGLAFTGANGQASATSQGSGGTFSFDSPTQMDGLGYTLELDLNGNGTFGDSGDVVDDSQNLNSSARNSVAWSGRDASGATPACGSYAYRVRATMAEIHLTQSDVESSGGTQIERLSLPSDAALGDPFAASYNDIDPYKSTPVTDASPSAVNQGTSGPGFHSWTVVPPGFGTGNGDFVDTWMRLPEVTAAGTLQVLCADLSVAKSAPAAVEPGGQVTWTITVRNEGPVASPGATVTDTLPAGIANVATSTGGCQVAGAVVECAIGALAPGASAEITVTGTAPATTSTCFTNTVTVTAAQDDPVGANNTAARESCTRGPRHDLSMTKTASRATATVGDAVTYTLEARNAGPDAAPEVVVRDRVPANFDVRDATTTRGMCTVDGNEVACAVGSLAAGESVTVTVGAVAVRAGATTNTAVVEPTPPPGAGTEQGEAADPPGDNSDGAPVRVLKPRLRLTKRADRASVPAGDTISYTIRVRNPSEVSLRRVRVCDRLPAGLVLVRATPRGRMADGRYCWSPRRLAAGKAQTYRLTARTLPGARGRTVNRATANSSEARTARATRTVRVIASRVAGGGVTG